MYNVSKLSSDSKQFLQNISSTSNNNQEVVLMAISKAVANELALPSSQVENPTEFYLNTVYTAVRNLISTINEMIVFDLNRAQEVIKTFWLVRYNILYPRKKLFLTNSVISESHFFGFSSLLSPTDATFIQQNTNLLLVVCNGFSQMISEIGGTESVTPIEIVNAV